MSSAQDQQGILRNPYAQHSTLDPKDTPWEFFCVLLTVTLKAEDKTILIVPRLGMLALGLGNQRDQGWDPGSAT